MTPTTTSTDTTLTVRRLAVTAASGLLSNDSDADGDGLTITGRRHQLQCRRHGEPHRGRSDHHADGSYTFTPAADYTGPVPVASYTVSDGNGGTDTATLTAPNAPVATNDSDSTAIRR